MKVTPPPKSSPTVLAKIIAYILEKKITRTPYDDKGRYLHWHKLRYLPVPKEFNTIEQYWHFIKFNRFGQYKQLPFSENFVYILTDDIQKSIHKIDSRMHGTVEINALNSSNKRKYITNSLIEEAISSSQLEGAVTTRSVAKNMLKNNKKPTDTSQQMIYNNYLAVQFIDEHKHKDLTPNLILELHQIITAKTLTESECGQLRKDNQINVWHEPTQKILHTPPNWKTLPKRLQILCNFANGKTPEYFIHPVIRAIIVHFILAYDHPFTDGNGRTARTLFYWVMLKNNYWLFQYITLSTYIKKTPAKYGKSFLYTETDNFDLTYFILSQLQFVNQAIDGLHHYIEKQYDAQQQASKLLSAYLADGVLNPRQVMLIQHAVQNTGAIYRIAEYKNNNGVSYQTAKTDLEKLVKLKLLYQSKQGKTFIFIATNDLGERIKQYKNK